MLWALFALLSAFCNAFSNILDKKYITGEGKDPFGYAFFRTIFATISYSILFLFAYSLSDTWSGGNFVLYAAICGAVTAVSGIFFYYAIQLANVSKISPILRLRIVFILIFSLIFLHEIPSVAEIGGAVFVILGTYLVVLEKGVKMRADKAVIFSLLNVIAASSLFVITKMASSLGDAFTYNLISILVLLMVSSVFILFRREQFKRTYRILSASNEKRWIAVSSFFSSLKVVFLFLALADAQAFAVAPIQQSSTLFTTVFAYFLLNEKINLKRMAGIVAIMLGLVLVSL